MKPPLQRNFVPSGSDQFDNVKFSLEPLTFNIDGRLKYEKNNFTLPCMQQVFQQHGNASLSLPVFEINDNRNPLSMTGSLYRPINADVIDSRSDIALTPDRYGVSYLKK